VTRVMLNFQHTGCAWAVDFVEADGRLSLRPRPRFHDFPTVEHLRRFVARCHPEEGELEYFEQCVQAWGRGSVYATLTPEECYGWGIAPMRVNVSTERG
jgi:hypothetical protein